MVLAYKWAWGVLLQVGVAYGECPPLGMIRGWYLLTSRHGTYLLQVGVACGQGSPGCGRARLQVGVAHGQGSPGTVACVIYMWVWHVPGP